MAAAGPILQALIRLIPAAGTLLMSAMKAALRNPQATGAASQVTVQRVLQAGGARAAAAIEQLGANKLFQLLQQHGRFEWELLEGAPVLRYFSSVGGRSFSFGVHCSAKMTSRDMAFFLHNCAQKLAGTGKPSQSAAQVLLEAQKLVRRYGAGGH